MENFDEFLEGLGAAPSLTAQVLSRQNNTTPVPTVPTTMGAASSSSSNNNNGSRQKSSATNSQQQTGMMMMMNNVKQEKKEKKESGKVRKRDEENHPHPSDDRRQSKHKDKDKDKDKKQKKKKHHRRDDSSDDDGNSNDDEDLNKARFMMMMPTKIAARPAADALGNVPKPAKKDKKSKKEKKEKKRARRDRRDDNDESDYSDDDYDQQDQDQEDDLPKKMKIVKRKVLVKKKVKREQPPQPQHQQQQNNQEQGQEEDEHAKLAREGKWACLCCTFINDNKVKNCEMCTYAKNTRICVSCRAPSKALKDVNCKKCGTQLEAAPFSSSSSTTKIKKEEDTTNNNNNALFDEIEVEEEIEEEVTDDEYYQELEERRRAQRRMNEEKKQQKDKKEKKDKKDNKKNKKDKKDKKRNKNNRNDLDDDEEALLLPSVKSEMKREATGSSSPSSSSSSSSSSNQDSDNNDDNSSNDLSEWAESESDTDDDDSSETNSFFDTSSDDDDSYDSDDDANSRRHRGRNNKNNNNNNNDDTLLPQHLRTNEQENERARREVEEDQGKLREFLEEMAARCAHNDIKPADPPASMARKACLKEFQLQALAWAIGREAKSNFVRNNKLEEDKEAEREEHEQSQRMLQAQQQRKEQQQDQQGNEDDAENQPEQNDDNPNNNNMMMMDMNNNNNNNNNVDTNYNLLARRFRRRNNNNNNNYQPLTDADIQLRQAARYELAENKGRLTQGGIIGDTMGMGKTRMMISVCEATRDAAIRRVRQNAFDVNMNVWSRATLIVCPVAIIQNWINEIRSTVDGHRKILRYHGSERSITKRNRTRFAFADYDYVLTTYHTLAIDLRMSSGNYRECPLSTTKWHRVVLDEGHVIRNPTSKISEAACTLQGENRWIITATPFVNRVNDFYPLAKFLNVPHFAEKPWWDEHIATQIENAYEMKNTSSDDVNNRADREVHKALRPLQILLAGLMIRRTLDTKHPRTGEPILVLPPKHLHEVPISLSTTEKALYDQVFDGAKMKIDALTKYNPAARVGHSGLSFQMSNGEYKRRLFACAFEMLVRCRQACSHVYLMVTSMQKKRAAQNGGNNNSSDSPGNRQQQQAPIVTPEEAVRIAAEQLERQKLEFIENLTERLNRAHAAANRGGAVARRRQNNGNNPGQVQNFVREKIEEYVRNGKFVDTSCCICLDDELNQPAMPPCAHPACKPCLVSALETTQKCPLCKREFRVNQLIDLEEERQKLVTDKEHQDRAEEEAAKPDVIDTMNVGPMKDWSIGAKARELLELLSSFPDDETHVLVFSQFLTFIDYLRVLLNQHGHETCMYNGSLNITQRTAVLNEFAKPLRGGARPSARNSTTTNDSQQQNGNNGNNGSPRGSIGDQMMMMMNMGSNTHQQQQQAEAAMPTPFGGGARPPSRFSAGSGGGFFHIKKEEKMEPEDGTERDDVPLGAATAHHNQQQQNNQNNNNNNDNNNNAFPFRRKKVLLATIQSCGVGLNITCATRCILLDPCWNISMEEQAIARCHRIGQQRPVHVYRLFIKDSVETHMMNLAKAKAEFAEKCLSVVGESGRGGAGAAAAGGGRRGGRGGGMALTDLMKIFSSEDTKDDVTHTAHRMMMMP